MRDRLLVIVAPKEKVMVRKWMYTTFRKEVIEKYKLDYLTTFGPHDLPAKQNVQNI